MYLLTGSLLMPMLLHIALDLRVLAGGRTPRPQAREVQGREHAFEPVAGVEHRRRAAASTPLPCTRSRVGAVDDAW